MVPSCLMAALMTDWQAPGGASCGLGEECSPINFVMEIEGMRYLLAVLLVGCGGVESQVQEPQGCHYGVDQPTEGRCCVNTQLGGEWTDQCGG